MESERKAIRSVTHQVLARQISCSWHAPFSLHASAHPVTAGPENLQCPAGSTQSLKNIGPQTYVWSTLCLAGGRVESLQKSFCRQVEKAEYLVQSVPWFEQPLSLAPHIPPEFVLHRLPLFVFSLAPAGSILTLTSGGYGSAGVQPERRLV